MNRSFWFGILFLVVSSTADARVFQNSYVKFELPDSWACHQEAAAWVCAPTNTAEAREALIISTAKLAGPDDSLNSFDRYLRKPKTVISKTKSSLSQPISVDRRKIGDQNWIEAVQIGSEVPNFTTRYLATVKQKLAILVSFSSDRDLKGKYEPVFEQAIRSIKADASKPILIQPTILPGAGASNTKAIIGQAVPQGPEANGLSAEAKALRQKKVWLFSLISLAAIGVLFALRKLV